MKETGLLRRTSVLGADLVLAAVVGVILLVTTWAIFLIPRVGLGFATTITIIFAVSLISITAGMWALHLCRGARNSFSILWPALIAPTIGGALLVVSALRWSGMPEWALQGDMVWNTANALFITEEGGVVFETHANPAPLTNAILALFYGVDPSFASVLRGNTIAIIAVLVIASLISGLHVARAADRAHRVVQFLMVLAVGWLPFTAIALDGMFRLGLANVLTSYLVLWISWIVFTSQDLSWSLQVTGLLVAATIMLASWALLAVLPCVLALFVFLEKRRVWKPALAVSRGVFVLPLIAFLQLVAYVFLVAIPDLVKAGSHLGASGAFPPLAFSAALVLLLMIVIVAVGNMQLLPRHSEGWRMGAGVVAILAVSFPVFLYLIVQRPAGEDFWGYYPMKLVSLLIFLLEGVAVSMIATRLSEGVAFCRQLTIASSIVPLYLIAILAPAQWVIGLHTFAPVIPAAVSAPVTERVQMINDLIAVQDADLEGIEVFVGWISGQDALANSFLFQLAVERGDDPVRAFAYTFDPNDRKQLCDIATVAGEQVTVFTHINEQKFVDMYLADCGFADQVSIRSELP